MCVGVCFSRCDSYTTLSNALSCCHPATLVRQNGPLLDHGQLMISAFFGGRKYLALYFIHKYIKMITVKVST
jgi:hypothetical protein